VCISILTLEPHFLLQYFDHHYNFKWYKKLACGTKECFENAFTKMLAGGPKVNGTGHNLC